MPWTGAVSYLLQGKDAITGQPISFVGNSVPGLFKPIPVGTYSVRYVSGGPPGMNVVVGPVITILDSDNWNPTFTISFRP